jgi:hypothetical protein
MRRVIAALAALVVVIAVAAVAQARPTASVTVTLSGWSAGQDEDNLLRQVVANFEKSHPNIKVDYSVINGDYSTAMTSRFAAHNPPDVFYVDSSLASTWAQQGVLQPHQLVHRGHEVRHEQVLSRPAERVQGRQDDLRLPEGLVAARDGDQHRDARSGEGQSADDLG